MAGNAIWKGNIHFGAVDVPVKLHSAVKEERIQFHLLHKRDHVKLKQQMICSLEKVPVPAQEQAKGYKLEDSQYILIDPEDLDQAEPKESRIIEVHEFVKTERIDPIFFERVYYLEPEAPIKGYSALMAALAEMDVDGICTWTMKKRSYLGALQTSGKILRLQTLRYSDEVIPARSLEVREASLSEKELKIGSDLINQLTGPFEPQKFENEHQKRLQSLIAKKTRGEKIVVLRPRLLKPTQPDNLLQVLKASLKKAA